MNALRAIFIVTILALSGCASGLDFLTSMMGLNVGSPSCSDVPVYKRDMWGLIAQPATLVPACTDYYATPSYVNGRPR